MKVFKTETVWEMSGDGKDSLLGGRGQCSEQPSQHSQRYSYKDFNARGETHQAINFSRTTFGKISNQGSENTECSESGLTPLTSAMVAAVMAGALGFSIPEPTSVTY